MLVLAFVACLTASPTECSERHLTFVVDHAVTPQQCMANGMPELARWSEANPKWFVRRFKCVPAYRYGKGA